MFKDFLEAPKLDLSGDVRNGSLGKQIKLITLTEDELPHADLALIGVPESRHSGKNNGCRLGPDAIRKELYRLSSHGSKISIVDLGNIVPGESFADTETALKLISESLLKENILPVIMGGGAAITYSLYAAMQPVIRNAEVTLLTPYFDLEEHNHFHRICVHEPNFLFNLNILGYQSYYVNPDELLALEKMYFNPVRLGLLRGNMQESEPVLRNTHFLAADIGVVKQADAPANYYSNPNGLTSEEICQLCWYAGVSDNLKILGIFDVNPEFDYRNQTAKLASQMIWYFIDGYYNRKADVPGMHAEFIKYRCTLNGNHNDVIFYKSRLSERWWMEIHEGTEEKEGLLIPCSYNDYKTATTGDMPDRYWKAIQKLL